MKINDLELHVLTPVLNPPQETDKLYQHVRNYVQTHTHTHTIHTNSQKILFYCVQMCNSNTGSTNNKCTQRHGHSHTRTRDTASVLSARCSPMIAFTLHRRWEKKVSSFFALPFPSAPRVTIKHQDSIWKHVCVQHQALHSQISPREV